MCIPGLEWLRASCWRRDPCSHHFVSLPSHTFPVPKPLPILTRPCLLLLPLFSCFFLTHIRPSSDFDLPHFTRQHRLGDCPSQFFLIIAASFFSPSSSCFPWISPVPEDVMSPKVFMFVLSSSCLWTQQDRDRTKFLSVSCEIPFVWPAKFQPPHGH